MHGENLKLVTRSVQVFIKVTAASNKALTQL